MKENIVNEDQELAGVANENLAAQRDGHSCVAGRELDALIAERVMGFVWVRLNRRDTSVCLLTAEKAANFWSSQPSDKRVLESANCYSTEIAAAMEVVEKLRTSDHIVCFECDGPSWHMEVWKPFQRSYGRGKECVARNSADSLPLVICRAALQATNSAVSAGTTDQGS